MKRTVGYIPTTQALTSRDLLPLEIQDTSEALTLSELLPPEIQYTSEALTFSDLPLELQEEILVQAAVARLLDGEYFEEVCAAMAPVCRHWNALLGNQFFRDQVMKLACLTDPMCRYVNTIIRIRIEGLERQSRLFHSAVPVGDKLYVLEQTPYKKGFVAVTSLFVYDVDYNQVHHKKPSQRKITLSNRIPVEVFEKIHNIIQLIPCPRTHYLYVMESCRNYSSKPVIVHKLNPDGTEVFSWNVCILGNDMIYASSLTKAGGYLALISSDSHGAISMNIYNTSTGAHVDYRKHMVDTDDDRVIMSLRNNGAVQLDKQKMDIVARPINSMQSSILDDHGCRIQISMSRLTLIDVETDDCRDLLGEAFYSSSPYFDKSRGLIFCADMIDFRILRITH